MVHAERSDDANGAENKASERLAGASEALTLVAALLLVASAGSFCGCLGEPSPIVATRVVLPAGLSPDAAKLHLVENGVDEYAGAPPPDVARVVSDGFDVHLTTQIGTSVEVKLHVWYDANGNHVEDHGDAAGDLAPSPFIAVDHGGCSDRVNHASPITLHPI